ncbi:MAG: hypothetical protein NVSMB51_22220 [Solirubrobacteraceae bacterium]
MSISTDFDLTAAVEREHGVLPAEVLAVPSMLSYDERALLHWATREGFGARGQIVDAGCYLGGSTLALAHGLAARSPREDGGERTRVHSFDIFEVGDERERAYFTPDFPFARGASILPLFERNVAGVRDLVTIRQGDINVPGPWHDDVAVCFIDIAKSWQTNDSVIAQFFPSLAPGAIVIQQDLVHFGHPWCALTMELLSEHFDYLGYVPYSTAVYRAKGPIPPDELPLEMRERLTSERARQLIDSCAARVGEPHAGFLKLAAACVSAFYGECALASELTEGVAARYDDATLPWISEAIAYMRAFIAGVESGAIQP